MTFTLLQMLNQKANKFANFQSKVAIVNKLLGSCEDSLPWPRPWNNCQFPFNCCCCCCMYCCAYLE